MDAEFSKLKPLLLAIAMSTAGAFPAFAADVAIGSASVEIATNVVTIKGINFAGNGSRTPTRVLLGEALVPLQLWSTSDGEIRAFLPLGLAPGSYRLTVTYGPGEAQFDTFDFTLGAVGPAGDKGDKGADGLPGPPGAKGDIGPQGPKGDTGANGPKGDTGAAGAIGPKGDTGATGPKGDTGAAGAIGLKGDPGATGPKGDAGAAGATGPKGDTGPAGPQGAQGPQGLQGPTGPQGPQGATGASGAAGQSAKTVGPGSHVTIPGAWVDLISTTATVTAAQADVVVGYNITLQNLSTSGCHGLLRAVISGTPMTQTVVHVAAQSTNSGGQLVSRTLGPGSHLVTIQGYNSGCSNLTATWTTWVGGQWGSTLTAMVLNR